VEPAFFTSKENWRCPYCRKCFTQYHILLAPMWESP
jgi:hypothetical protein